MTQAKKVVATHEAGHALITLMTPLRHYVKHARIFLADSEWRGDFQMDGRAPDKDDPKKVFEVAKGLAGPLAQIHFFPDTISPDLKAIIAAEGGLLGAAKLAIRQRPDIQAEWWRDLEGWIGLCADPKFVGSADFVRIEQEIDWFLKSADGGLAIQEIAQRLEAGHFLDRGQLLSIPLASLPALNFPDDLRSP